MNIRPSVGASLLAKSVNDNADIPDECGALRFFASKLAPTGVGVFYLNSLIKDLEPWT